MTRPRRVILGVVVGFVVLTVVPYIGCQIQTRRDDAVRAKAHAKAQALKNEIDARHAPGNPQEETLAALKHDYEGRFIYTGLVEGGGPPGLHYWIVVAEQPSGVWFCDGTASVTVSADFDAGRFVGTTIHVRLHGCL